MATLGQPSRVSYISKGLQSGLTDIVAYISKPSGSIVGPFELEEFENSNFSGFYYFDFYTNKANDSYGTYTGVIISNSEKVRTPFKLDYDNIDVGDLSGIVNEVNTAIKMLNKVDVEVEIDEIEQVEVTILDE